MFAVREVLINSPNEMKREAHGTQQPGPINKIGEEAHAVQQSDPLAQSINQRFLSLPANLMAAFNALFSSSLQISLIFK